MYILFLLCLLVHGLCEHQTLNEFKSNFMHNGKKESIFRANLLPQEFEELNSKPEFETTPPVKEDYSDFISGSQEHEAGSTAVQRPETQTENPEIPDNTPQESRYSRHFLPSKMETDAKYERLKSAMYYKPDKNEEYISKFAYSDYYVDEEDVRNSRGNSGSWPFFYHTPYEYEQNMMDSQREKAMDKRYAIDSHRVIPIYEEQPDDVPNVFSTYRPVITTLEARTTTDNPMEGEDPFFKFILNDYFDRNRDDDRLTFKGVHWGNDFDSNPSLSDLEELRQRSRRRHLTSYETPTHRTQRIKKYSYGDTEPKLDYYENKDYSNFNTNDNNKESARTEQESNKQGITGFKDFVDTFANKFGHEDHKKNSSYLVNNNLDKGEKSNGFRRVYHKDEYQEDKQFYNNNGQKYQIGDKGASNIHIGGSEGFLGSHAAAALGNITDNLSKSSIKDHKVLSDMVKSYDKLRQRFDQFNRDRDIARETAMSNEEDYSEPYRIK